jgi:methionyl aminopeptidase
LRRGTESETADPRRSSRLLYGPDASRVIWKGLRAKFPSLSPPAASRTMSIVIKNAEDIAGMRVAGRLAAEVLDFITPHVKTGVTTTELDRLCHDYMVHVQGTTPAPLNYAPPGYRPFPKSICTSVNHQVCHGIPGDRVLKNGDIVNIDITVIKDGYHGDTSRMFYVGEPSIAARRLCEVTYECMWLGIRQVRPGGYLGDIGHAIQTHAEKHGYNVVREFCGHGIGRRFHEEPQVLHYGRPGTLERLVPGMTFTVEPMINAGRRDIKELADGWTIVTKDHSLSAQWEHTVLVTEEGYEVLTLSGATPPPPAFVSAARTGAALAVV